MKTTYIFPIILIILDIGAAFVNLCNKDYKMAIYWIAAAVLNAAGTGTGNLRENRTQRGWHTSHYKSTADRL